MLHLALVQSQRVFNSNILLIEHCCRMNPLVSDTLEAVLYAALQFAANSTCSYLILLFSLVSKFSEDALGVL